MSYTDSKISNNINGFFIYLINKAHSMRESAGYNGDHHDGGARGLEIQVEAYRAGMASTIPPCWKTYYEEFTKTQDPEYQTYISLKQKFEGGR